VKNNTLQESNINLAALLLRVGLALVFIIGGTSKLSLLLGDATHDGMVANYMSTSGYINSIFQEYLFTGMLGQFITPSGFLTTLSTFELVSGIALLAGFLVKPLSLFYAFLLWTFVIALPTMTVPGFEIEAKTYTSPAIFVQIRDIALSGFMFVLFNLGAGSKSVDGRFIASPTQVNWDNLGLLLRLSLASSLIVGGFFGEFGKVGTFATPQWLLAITGLVLVFGSQRVLKIAAAITMGIMLWYMVYKLNFDNSVIKNLNDFKREFALFTAGAVLVLFGGGDKFTFTDFITRAKVTCKLYLIGVKN